MMKILMIAMLCHSANAAYCRSIGDDSQVPWGQAPHWQQDSAMRSVEFCQANPDAPASANHESWMAQKIADGWVYGEKKDPEAKPPTHPCIVPFDQLPVEQRTKDVLFKAIVAGCAELQDIEVQSANQESSYGLDDEYKTKLEGERDAAIARAEKAELAVTAAKAKVSRGDTPAKPRKISAMEAKLHGGELSEAIDDADKVEIVFSDGAKELTQLAPIVVEGDVWRRHALGMMLREPVTIHGPSTGGSSYQIDGYGLVLDGKQVAYCKRADPINVAPGQTYSLADDIYFQ